MTVSSESDRMCVSGSLGPERTACWDDLNRSAPLLWHLPGSRGTKWPLTAVVGDVRLWGRCGQCVGGPLPAAKSASSCPACLPFSNDRCFTRGRSWCQVGICVSQNDLTGEHSCIMLKTLMEEDEADRGAWLPAFWKGKLDGKGGSEVTGWGPPDL